MKKSTGFLSVILAVLLMCLCMPHVEAKAADNAKKNVKWLSNMKLLDGEMFNAKKILKKPQRKITRDEFKALILAASGQDIGAAGGTAGGSRAILRQAAAQELGALLGLAIDLEVPEFADADKVSKNAKRYVNGLYSVGIIEVEGENYGPKEKLTWDEAAGMVKRAYLGGYFESNSIRLVAGNATGIDEDILNPTGLSYDSAGKRVFFCDTDNNCIKKYEDGKVTVVCGRLSAIGLNGVRLGGYADGEAEFAMFNAPTDVKLVEGGLLISDTGNNAIRFYSFADGKVSTFAGTGKAGAKDAKRFKATFNTPMGLAVDSKGNVYVADSGNNCIRKIGANGKVKTVAGVAGKTGFADGSADVALFNYPTDVAVKGKKLYVADAGNQRIRLVLKGKVTTAAGGGDYKYDGTEDYVGDFRDGNAEDARFSGPVAICADRNGTIYISDAGNSCIRMLKKGRVTTIEGFGEPSYSLSRNPSEMMTTPFGIDCAYGEGFVYVADSYRKSILQIPIPE